MCLTVGSLGVAVVSLAMSFGNFLLLVGNEYIISLCYSCFVTIIYSIYD
jgi:hypothetical protein